MLFLYFFHAALDFFLLHAASPEDHISPKPISPPAYTTLATGPSTSTPVITSPPAAYPAVLVGRPTSSLSEIKPKIPPPVPPRGTPKAGRPSQTNGKGANLLNTNGNLLHDLLCLSVSGSIYSSDSSDNQSEKYFSSCECTNRLENLKRYDKSSDLNVDLLAGRIKKRKSINKRSISLREKYLDECTEKNGSQTLPKYKEKHKINTGLRKYKKYSTSLDEYAKSPETSRKEELKNIEETKIKKQEIKLETKRKINYGIKVKALKNIFDKTKDQNGASQIVTKHEEMQTYRKPRYNPNFVGTSSYLDRKRQDSIPRIIISPTTYESNSNPLSPQKNTLCEVYNSRLARKYYDFNRSDLGDLV